MSDRRGNYNTTLQEDILPGGWSLGNNSNAISVLSAVCYFFGREFVQYVKRRGEGGKRRVVCFWFLNRSSFLFRKVGVPIGLIGSNYGGTMIEGWSSPAALAKCNFNLTGCMYMSEERDREGGQRGEIERR